MRHLRIASREQQFQPDLESDRVATHRNIDGFVGQSAAAERIDSDDRRLKFYRGILFVVEKKNPAEAESMLKSYIATVPDNSDLPAHSQALEWLGKLHESQGKFSEAAENYRAALALDPHNKSLEESWKRMKEK